MSKNPNGSLSRSNMEWGGKARKEEDRIRGARSRATREVINERLDDLVIDEIDTDNSKVTK